MIRAMPAVRPLDELNYDPLAPYPEIKRAEQAMRLGDWATVRAVYGTLPWDGRTSLVRTADRHVEDFLTGLVAHNPSDTLAATMLAESLVDKGWTIRTSARATHVAKEQFAALHDCLRQAERLLIDVTAREPGNVAAWVIRLITARGLELGQSEARRRYDRASAHAPHLMQAQTQMLQQLCPKWGGSFERMHEFAWNCTMSAPEGAPNGIAVADGHIEHWMDLDSAESARYFADPSVRQEIQQAAARSVLHPRFGQPYGWVSVRNSFAMVLCLIDDYPSAGRQFEALGNLATEGPWHYLGNAEQEFRRKRSMALAAVGR